MTASTVTTEGRRRRGGAGCEGRVAAITGAASGIGAAIADLLAAEGAHVVGLDLTSAQTEVALQVDVADATAVTRSIDRIEREFGPIDILITVAGHYAQDPIEAITTATWNRMLSVHLGGTANSVAATIAPMSERGRGRIVTIASELALAGGSRDAHYVTAKGAIIGLTAALASELEGSGIDLTCVVPGPTDTPLLSAASRSSEYVSSLPMRRLVTADEVAEAVRFALANSGAFRGQVISPNGGTVI